MSSRKTAAVLAVFMKVCFLLPLGANPNFYGNVADNLNRIYRIDNNAGLTTFPVLNIPMGGRSEGMASAFAAVADDISFLEHNPAGSSMLARSELAFFHNNWIADTNIEGIAYATRFNNLGLAAGARWLYTPFTEYNIYGERVSSGHYSEGVMILNISYNFFAGYNFGGISLGVNLKGAFRLMPDFTGDDDVIISGSGLSQSAVMGMADVGLLTRFNFLKTFASREKNAAAALVVRNLGPPALGEPLPTVVNAAVSFRPIRPLILAYDFFVPVNMMDISLSERPYMALGAALNVTNFLSMRAGFMLRGGSSRVTIGSGIQFNRIALEVNYTLDLLTQLQPLNRVSLGVRLDMGDRGLSYRAARVDELYLLGLDAFSQGLFDEARACWEEALRINPRFDPAREAMQMLENRQELYQRVEDLFRLDF